MSKCRPEAGFEFAAIADFLRSVHINGKPLELPSTISELHVHPRLSLNMAKSINTASFEHTAAAFDVAESAAAVPAANLSNRLQLLDERLNTILSRLEQKEP